MLFQVSPAIIVISQLPQLARSQSNDFLLVTPDFVLLISVISTQVGRVIPPTFSGQQS